MGGGKGKVRGWGYGGNESPCRCTGLKLFNELRIDEHGLASWDLSEE
jgi:hypothetical protein